MRLTILINGSDPTVNHDYAVLWLDTDEHRWSREAHEGIDLPPWGELHDTDGVTKLCDPSTNAPLCTLSGLQVDHKQQIVSAEGAAEWTALAAAKLPPASRRPANDPGRKPVFRSLVAMGDGRWANRLVAGACLLHFE